MKSLIALVLAAIFMIVITGDYFASDQGFATTVASNRTTQHAPPLPWRALSVSLSKSSSEDIRSVIARLNSDTVDKIYVYSALDVETPTAMTPSILQDIYSEKLEFEVTPQRKRLLASMLEKLKLSPYDSEPETQIGLVLVDSAANWQYTILCDRFGMFGLVGGRRVRMSENFLHFVRKLFAPIN